MPQKTDSRSILDPRRPVNPQIEDASPRPSIAAAAKQSQSDTPPGSRPTRFLCSITRRYVQAHFEVDWSCPEWIEDEPVRCGARHAHLLDDDLVSVTVCATSHEAAEDLVRELLDRVSAKTVEVVAPELALV